MIRARFENNVGELNIDTGEVVFHNQTFKTITEAIIFIQKEATERKLFEDLFHA